jgi:hypothetical protein
MTRVVRAIAPPFWLAPLLVALSGCGGEGKAAVEIHAWGSIDAFGRAGETSLVAAYSSKLDDASCKVLDGRSECVLVRCSEDEAGALEDAGEVTVGNDALDIAVDNTYSLVLGEELVAGETLEMRATGSSAVPKHSGAVVVPERAEITSSLGDPLVFSTTEDSAITWTPLDSDRVVLSLAFGELEIDCTASGTVGAITVAARLVAALPDDEPGTFSIMSENLDDSSVEGWRVWFGAHQVIAEGAAELDTSQ